MKNNYEGILRELHLKVTPKRLAILEILASSVCCLTPDEIWKGLKKKFGRIGLPTVYKNLEELSEGGVISRVIHPERRIYYYFCRNRTDHCHFVCLDCHNVEDIMSSTINALQKNIERLLEGKVLSQILQFNGLCKDCLQNYDKKKSLRNKYGINKHKD